MLDKCIKNRLFNVTGNSFRGNGTGAAVPITVRDGNGKDTAVKRRVTTHWSRKTLVLRGVNIKVCYHCYHCYVMYMFCYATPCLWNQLPLSLRQPHSGTSSSISYSSIPSPITSSSFDSLCSSITLSLFHCRLKTYLFHKSYPP